MDSDSSLVPELLISMCSKQGKNHKYYILPQDKGFQSEGLLPNSKHQGNVMEMGHRFPECKVHRGSSLEQAILSRYRTAPLQLPGSSTSAWKVKAAA